MDNLLSKLLTARAQDARTASRIRLSVPDANFSFPLMIQPGSPGQLLSGWIEENKEELELQLKKHGAILFRGFGIDTIERFQCFIGLFDAPLLEYKQRSSPRYEVVRHVYHSTTYPQELSINMHCENSYAPQWPMKIIFCCVTPADEQGETPVADCRQVLGRLNRATRDIFRDKGVLYVRNISPELGLSWEEVFQTRDKAQVEAECRTLGMKLSWKDADRLTLSWTNLAIHRHPQTGEETWFNHAFFFNKYTLSEEVLAAIESDDELPFNTYFGDGSVISREYIEEIRLAYEKSTVCFPWHRGDVLLMDNMLMAHGRRPFRGDRKIVVSMF